MCFYSLPSILGVNLMNLRTCLSLCPFMPQFTRIWQNETTAGFRRAGGPAANVTSPNPPWKNRRNTTAKGTEKPLAFLVNINGFSIFCSASCFSTPIKQQFPSLCLKKDAVHLEKAVIENKRTCWKRTLNDLTWSLCGSPSICTMGKCWDHKEDFANKACAGCQNHIWW